MINLCVKYLNVLLNTSCNNVQNLKKKLKFKFDFQHINYNIAYPFVIRTGYFIFVEIKNNT